MKNPLAWAGLLALFLPSLAQPAIEDLLKPGPLQKLKSTVVNIEYTRPVGLARDDGERGAGTGFIADAEKGLVVTNQHITGQSPLGKINVIFWNGESTDANLLYYDPWHDFAFLKFDPAKVKGMLSDVTFGRLSDIKEGDPVLLIGNVSAEGFSIKTGNVNRLRVLRAFHDLGRLSHQIHLSLARSGGASGSPVFDSAGHVVALHTSGRENESFELRIEYVTRALEFLRRDETPPRGDLSISPWFAPVRKALNYFKLNPTLPPKSSAPGKEDENVLLVGRVVPGSPTAAKLHPGDILLGVRGKSQTETVRLGDDIYTLDRIVDENVAGEVEFTLFRDGKTRRVRVPVADAQTGKLTRFARFAGGTLHDITPGLSLSYDLEPTGVFLSESDAGSALEMGRAPRESSKKRRVVIRKIGTEPVRTLDDFIRIARGIQRPESLVFWVEDAGNAESRTDWFYVDVNPKFGPLEIYAWNPVSLNWDVDRPAPPAHRQPLLR